VTSLSDTLFAQLVGLCTGALLLSSLLMAWRHSLGASIRILAAQGVALAALVAVIGWHSRAPELVAVAVGVAVLKGAVLPGVLARRVTTEGTGREDSPRVNPTVAIIGVSLLTTLGYLATRPLTGLGTGPAARAVPVGVSMVLIGFWLLVIRRRAMSQLVSFVLLDNGIATVAFLTAEGVPFVVELGASLDVLLVVVILHAFMGSMYATFGGTDVDDLMELAD
jgi:hydrogenase-4 component E